MIGTLQVLLKLYIRNREFKKFITVQAKDSEKDHNVLHTILFLVNGDYEAVKSHWLEKVICKSVEFVKQTIYRSEDEYGYAGVKHWFPVKRHYFCSNSVCCSDFEETCDGFTDDSLLDQRPFSADHFLLMVNQKITSGKPCVVCENELRLGVEFVFKNMPFIAYAIYSNVEDCTTESTMRLTQIIKGVKYRVFAYTCVLYPETENSHFVVKFFTTTMIAKV